LDFRSTTKMVVFAICYPSTYVEIPSNVSFETDSKCGAIIYDDQVCWNSCQVCGLKACFDRGRVPASPAGTLPHGRASIGLLREGLRLRPKVRGGAFWKQSVLRQRRVSAPCPNRLPRQSGAVRSISPSPMMCFVPAKTLGVPRRPGTTCRTIVRGRRQEIVRNVMSTLK